MAARRNKPASEPQQPPSESSPTKSNGRQPKPRKGKKDALDLNEVQRRSEAETAPKLGIGDVIREQVEAEHQKQIDDISRAYAALEAADANGKASLKEHTQNEARTWAVLKGAVEEAIPADQPQVARAEAMLTKLHRTEIAWQDYLDAREAKKEEQKAVKQAVKAAKATLDRAIRSAESGQTDLF